MRRELPFLLIASLLLLAGFVVVTMSTLQTEASVPRQEDDDPPVVTVEVTREVTRIATVIVTPTFTPLPPTPTPLPPEITVDDDHFLGAEDAPVKVVEFSDYRCGFCRVFYHETLYQLNEHYGDAIQFVYRDYPIFGELSLNAAIAAECAGDQGAFWEFHNLVFDSQSLEQAPDLTQETLAVMAESLELDVEAWQVCFASREAYDEIVIDALSAQEWGVTGTPTFFINGKRMVGAQPLENFLTVIDAELTVLGIEPPARPAEAQD